MRAWYSAPTLMPTSATQSGGRKGSGERPRRCPSPAPRGGAGAPPGSPRCCRRRRRAGEATSPGPPADGAPAAGREGAGGAGAASGRTMGAAGAPRPSRPPPARRRAHGPARTVLVAAVGAAALRL